MDTKLTLEEKAVLLQGKSVWTTWEIPRLDIPSVFLADGPHGLRKQAGSSDHLGLHASLPATCFPTAATMANSWDPALGEELGSALGAEAAAQDVHVVLGPGLNMKRTPLCGRNFEYFSEDPYLAGKMAAAYIRGIQSKGPAACPKHFAVNSQETRRMAVDAVVDERTLREIYLTGFEIAVKEGSAKAIMSSYNRVNGTYANENAHLLEEILRNEWGFDGFVVTDWGADNDHVAGVKSGCNLVMPAPGMDAAMELVQAVKTGQLDEAVLDQRVEQLLQVVRQVSRDVANAPKEYCAETHHQLAKRCATESIVLLENDGILPLGEDIPITVIGDFAATPRYQGAGSSKVNATMADTFLKRAQPEGLQIVSYVGNDLKAAVEAAKQAHTILLFVGLDEASEAEGADREHMELPENQQMLIQKVCEVNPNVILVLTGGAPFTIPQCTYRGVVFGGLGGQAGAGALIDVLTGKVCPSGKLAQTWPLQPRDVPSHSYHSEGRYTCEYREGPFIGYRYFDTTDVPVRYPFGYGMSYTQFTYSQLAVTERKVTFTVTNTGSVDGAEVAQLYIGCPDSGVYRPRKELKGFCKVFLRAAEAKTVTIELDDKAFRYYDVQTQRWERETGTYRIMIGSSVADIRLEQELFVEGTTNPAKQAALAPYYTGHVENISDEVFETLLGRPIPDGSWQLPLTPNDTFAQLAYAPSRSARWLHRYLLGKLEKAKKQGKTDINILFIYNMPFRAICKTVGKWISAAMVEDFVFLVNGHFFRGMRRLAFHFFRHRKQTRKFMKKLKEG